MKTITLEQIVALHTYIVKETGGSDGIRDIGRLESVVASQTQSMFGEDTYKNLYEKTAAICRGIISDHPFVDGNKRTAMLVAITFLEINDYSFTAKKSEIEDYAVKVATEKFGIKEISEWLKKHTSPSANH